MLSPTRDARALQSELATLMSAWDGEEARGVSAFRKGRLQWSLSLTSVTPAGDYGEDEIRGLRRRLGVGTPEEAEAALRERQEAEIESVRGKFEDVSRVAARFDTTAEMGIEDGRAVNDKYAWIAVDVNRRHLVSPHRGAMVYYNVSGMLDGWLKTSRNVVCRENGTVPVNDGEPGLNQGFGLKSSWRGRLWPACGETRASMKQEAC